MKINGWEFYHVDPTAQPISFASGYRYWFYGVDGGQKFALNMKHLGHLVRAEKEKREIALKEDAASDGFPVKGDNYVER